MIIRPTDHIKKIKLNVKIVITILISIGVKDIQLWRTIPLQTNQIIDIN